MRGVRRLGLLLLGVWLVLSGLIQIVGLHFNGLPLLMGVLAIIAGALLILGR